MTSQMAMSPSLNGDHPAPLKKTINELTSSGEPALDSEGNVLPYPGYKAEENDKYGQTSPIPRLAAVAALGQKIPTAGGYAIEHAKLRSDVKIPPECFLYDEDRPWVLGKLNPAALDLPEPAEPVPLSQHVLDQLDALDAQFFGTGRSKCGDAAMPGMGEVVSPVNPNLASKTQGTLKKDGNNNMSTPQMINKIKNRNASISPARALRPGSGKSSPSRSPIVNKISAGGQSSARGASPKAVAKIVTSPRSGSKKIMNAKVDLEIVEKKN